MRRAIGVSSQLTEQLSDRPIMRNRIVFWLDRAKPIVSVWPCAKQATQVEVRLDALLLNVIEALVIGLPDIERCARDRPAFDVADVTVNHHILPLLVEADIGSHRQLRRAGDVEGPQHRTLGRSGRLAVVDCVDQHRHAEHIR